MRTIRIFYLIAICSLIAFKSNGQKTPKVFDKDKMQKSWAASKLTELSLEQKIGQLVLPLINAADTSSVYLAELESYITDYNIGGFIFNGGNPWQQVNMVNHLQSKSTLPLFFGIDTKGTQNFLYNPVFGLAAPLSIGAGRNIKVAEAIGDQVGKFYKKAGINFDFSIINNTNSNIAKKPYAAKNGFGTDPIVLRNMGTEYLEAMQKNRVMGTIKYALGYANVDDMVNEGKKGIPLSETTDLSEMNLSNQKLLAKRGLGAVVIGNANASGMGMEAGVPASLSKIIPNALIRKDWNFQGLIINNMEYTRRVNNKLPPGQIEVNAIAAGNNIVVIPSEIPEVIDALLLAVKDNKISEKDINSSVEKVLMAKYWMNLQYFEPIDITNFIRDFYTQESLNATLIAMENAITLVKNRPPVLPINITKSKPKITWITIGEGSNYVYQSYAAQYVNKIEFVNGNDYAPNQIATKAPKGEYTIVSYHGKDNSLFASNKMSQQDQSRISALSSRQNSIFVCFDSPNVLLDNPVYTEYNAILIAYQNSLQAQIAVVNAIFGVTPPKGKLPIDLSTVLKRGYGLSYPSIYKTKYSMPLEIWTPTDTLHFDAVAKGKPFTGKEPIIFIPEIDSLSIIGILGAPIEEKKTTSSSSKVKKAAPKKDTVQTPKDTVKIEEPKPVEEKKSETFSSGTAFAPNNSRALANSGQTNIEGYNSGGIIFAVQLCSVAHPLKEGSSNILNSFPNAMVYTQNVTRAGYTVPFFKYYIGPVATYKEATLLMEKARSMGYKQAFVIAFDKGIRVSVDQNKTTQEAAQEKAQELYNEEM